MSDAMDIYPIAAFVNARLDDVERAAHACNDAPWQLLVWPNATQILVAASAHRDDPMKFRHMGHVAMAEHQVDAEHMALHHPARVLAEVAAQRAIVANMCSLHEGAWQYDDARTAVEHLTLTTVRRLAQLDADHADYDPAWAL